jgi:hypothetical protein
MAAAFHNKRIAEFVALVHSPIETKAFAADSAGDDSMRGPLLYRVP